MYFNGLLIDIVDTTGSISAGDGSAPRIEREITIEQIKINDLDEFMDAINESDYLTEQSEELGFAEQLIELAVDRWEDEIIRNYEMQFAR